MGRARRQRRQRRQPLVAGRPCADFLQLTLPAAQRTRCLGHEITNQLRRRGKGGPHREEMRWQIVQPVMTWYIR